LPIYQRGRHRCRSSRTADRLWTTHRGAICGCSMGRDDHEPHEPDLHSFPSSGPSESGLEASARGAAMTNHDPPPELIDFSAPHYAEGLSAGFEEKRGTDYIVEVLEPRGVPLGGPRAMTVQRTIPQRARSLIGAWCFLDYFGP